MEIPHLRLWFNKDKIVQVRQLVSILCTLNFQDVTDRELDLLCEIIYHKGVNEKSKKSFMMNYRTSSANHGQVVKRLYDKGILINKENRTGKLLHNDFGSVMDGFIINNNIKMLAIIVPN